jgi:hypothetical protein
MLYVSLYYLPVYRGDPVVLPGAEIVRLCGHLVLGGITGFAVRMARRRMRRWGLALVGCLAVSTSLQFIWDYLALDGMQRGSMLAWQTCAAIAVMTSGMLVYGALVVVAAKWSRIIFAPDSKRGLLGWPFRHA